MLRASNATSDNISTLIIIRRRLCDTLCGALPSVAAENFFHTISSLIMEYKAEKINPYNDVESKTGQVRQMFDSIAPAYDFMKIGRAHV